MNQKYITTAGYYLAFILLGVTIGAEGPTLLKLAEHTHSQINEISWIFFFGSLGYLTGSYIGGRLYDRVSGHRLMVTVLLLLGIITIFVPLATSRALLFVIVLLLGLVKGALDVGCNTLLLWLHNEAVSPYMNGLHAAFGVGSFIAPLIVAVVLKATNDIFWVFWIFAIAAFPIALFIGRLPSPQPRAVPEQHQNSAFPILPVVIMVTCFVLYVGSEAGYGNWIYTYAFKRNFGTEITSNYLTSAFWGFFTLGRLIAIWISTRLKPLPILIMDFIGCVLSMSLILIFNNSVTALWIGSILLGISLASIFPTFLTLSEQRMHVTGAITGWFLVGGGLGGMIMPVIIGQAFERIGAASMMSIILASLMLDAAALFLFTKISRTATRAGTV